jgi:hypothetical protein
MINHSHHFCQNLPHVRGASMQLETGQRWRAIARGSIVLQFRELQLMLTRARKMGRFSFNWNPSFPCNRMFSPIK